MESFGRVLLRVLPRVLLLKIQILDLNFSSGLSLGTIQTDPTFIENRKSSVLIGLTFYTSQGNPLIIFNNGLKMRDEIDET